MASTQAFVSATTKQRSVPVTTHAMPPCPTLAGSASIVIPPITSGSVTTAAELHQQAAAVKEKAKSVDTFSHMANEHLNEAFKATYDALTARH